LSEYDECGRSRQPIVFFLGFEQLDPFAERFAEICRLIVGPELRGSENEEEATKLRTAKHKAPSTVQREIGIGS
jgi:hypothetical protein